MRIIVFGATRKTGRKYPLTGEPCASAMDKDIGIRNFLYFSPPPAHSRFGVSLLSSIITASPLDKRGQPSVAPLF